MSRPVFIAAPKTPSAIVPLAVDFAPALSLSGETMASAEVTITDRQTGTNTTAVMLVTGSIALAGDVVTFQVEGGSDNHDYVAHVEGETSEGRSEPADILLPVRIRLRPDPRS